MDDLNNTNNDINVPVEDSELEKYKKQAEEYLSGWKRAQADFINSKKDEQKRMGEFLKYANEGLVMEIVEVVDDLESAYKNLGDNSGLGQIIKKMQEVFNKYQVEKIKVIGQKFDPLLHDAIAVEPDGEKLEEVRSGYIMNGKVIRPARIKIIK